MLSARECSAPERRFSAFWCVVPRNVPARRFCQMPLWYMPALPRQRNAALFTVWAGQSLARRFATAYAARAEVSPGKISIATVARISPSSPNQRYRTVMRCARPAPVAAAGQAVPVTHRRRAHIQRLRAVGQTVTSSTAKHPRRRHIQQHHWRRQRLLLPRPKSSAVHACAITRRCSAVKVANRRSTPSPPLIERDRLRSLRAMMLTWFTGRRQNATPPAAPAPSSMTSQYRRYPHTVAFLTEALNASATARRVA